MVNSVIVFLRNPELGKVKTRLAAEVGNEKALIVYKDMLAYTLDVVKEAGAHMHLYFSEHINDTIGNNIISSRKTVQNGNDLGEKMNNAFCDVLNQFGGKVIIIGTDCPGINSRILLEAFDHLSNKDIVIGPAADGGYYLLGMKAAHPILFQLVEWSSSSVLQTTINRCDEYNLEYALLDELHDVDEEKDLVYYYNMMNQQEHD